MVDILEIPLVEINENREHLQGKIILLDTQPGAGNNPLGKEQKATIVFDHHPRRPEVSSIEYPDIREELGSTSTLIYLYMKALDIKPTVNVATALYYGIQTDVVGEGRRGEKIDYLALEELSKKINWQKLYSIENPKLPFDYFVHIDKGLKNSVLYENFIITSLGDVANPDYVGEIADFLIRYDKVNVVLAVGMISQTVHISFRSQIKKIDAGLAVKQIVGNLGSAGGHPSNAGGRIPYNDDENANKIIKKIITRSLDLINGKITTGMPLLSMSRCLNQGSDENQILFRL